MLCSMFVNIKCRFLQVENSNFTVKPKGEKIVSTNVYKLLQILKYADSVLPVYHLNRVFRNTAKNCVV